ncbi:hypothetical protein C8R44DRAFT_738414 [Mycena epipterygia]|nr:hypothetical protein C8R44DRAFT_738414 [Mycena epipterygia]
MYAKQTEDGPDEDVQLKLADTYIVLGDVSLETKKIDQASTAYEAGLAPKGELLPRSSRQIAESIECRLAELASPSTSSVPPDPKGKGKGKTRLVRDDLVGSMSAARTTKEFAGLKEDLVLKIVSYGRASDAVGRAEEKRVGARRAGARGRCTVPRVNKEIPLRALKPHSFRRREFAPCAVCAAGWAPLPPSIRLAFRARGLFLECAAAVSLSGVRRPTFRHSAAGATSHLAQLYGCGVALGCAVAAVSLSGVRRLLGCTSLRRYLVKRCTTAVKIQSNWFKEHGLLDATRVGTCLQRPKLGRGNLIVDGVESLGSSQQQMCIGVRHVPRLK